MKNIYSLLFIFLVLIKQTFSAELSDLDKLKPLMLRWSISLTFNGLTYENDKITEINWSNHIIGGQITNSDIDVFKSLTSLKKLILIGDFFKGSVPSEIANLKIDYLNISNNELEGDFPIFSNGEGPKEICLQNNKLYYSDIDLLPKSSGCDNSVQNVTQKNKEEQKDSTSNSTSKNSFSGSSIMLALGVIVFILIAASLIILRLYGRKISKDKKQIEKQLKIIKKSDDFSNEDNVIISKEFYNKLLQAYNGQKNSAEVEGLPSSSKMDLPTVIPLEPNASSPNAPPSYTVYPQQSMPPDIYSTTTPYSPYPSNPPVQNDYSTPYPPNLPIQNNYSTPYPFYSPVQNGYPTTQEAQNPSTPYSPVAPPAQNDYPTPQDSKNSPPPSNQKE